MSSSRISTEILNTIENPGGPLPRHLRATTTADTGDIGEHSRKHHAYTSEIECPGSDIPIASRMSPWNVKNILSLDGGGIRGLFSLYIIRQLMKIIENIERGSARHEGQDDGDCPMSSFCPAPTKAKFPSASLRANEQSQYNNFLPCHYFDYICGTSTGGLIAIMLARFRMSIDDCISEYHTLAGDVFGHPRKLHMISTILIPRYKYDEKALENAIGNVAKRRREATSSADSVRFKTERGICRAFVCASKQPILSHSNPTPEIHKSSYASEPYIFRSYDHHRRSDDPRGYPRNPGAASDFEVWQVGRATTAAPLYFKPLILSDRFSSQTSYLDLETWRKFLTTGSRTARSPPDLRPEYIDGGLGAANNPSSEAYHEVTTGSEKVGLLVSIGTARATRNLKTRRFSTLIVRIVKALFTQAGETQSVHRATERLSQEHGFEYFRFDDPGGLANVEFDDWKGKNGTETLKHIDIAFSTWAKDHATVLEACARDLVQRRKQRTQDFATWDRFACRSSYICGESGCQAKSGKDKWKYRNDFEAHLRDPTQGHAQNINFEDPNALQRIFTKSRQEWVYQPSTNGRNHGT